MRTPNDTGPIFLQQFRSVAFIALLPILVLMTAFRMLTGMSSGSFTSPENLIHAAVFIWVTADLIVMYKEGRLWTGKGTVSDMGSRSQRHSGEKLP